MSGFDDTNPFADPFSDPSIKQATDQTSSKFNFDENNPFETKSNEPAVLQTSTTNSSTFKQSNFGQQSFRVDAKPTLTQYDLQKRQEELEKKAAELAAREEALRNAQFTVKQNNWPPLPKICPIGPCFYQDINVEIAPEFQKIVRYVYYLWLSYLGILFINMLGGLAIYIVTEDNEIFSVSIMLFFLFSPLSFICWFRPLYKAFRNDSSFNFMVFFFVFFCQLVISVLWAIGVPSTGSCGLVIFFKNINKGVLFVIFLFIVTLALNVYSVASFLILLKVHSIYRHTGASFAKAQAELAQGVLGNERVQQAAAAAATGAARQAMNQAFGSNTNYTHTPGPGLRY